MFIDEESIRESLLRMVRRITPNVTLRDDLLQEALIHLWLTEARRPAQTKSWYLQSCKFHLLHYLASGRSIDSAKRRCSQMQMSEENESREDFLEQADSGNSVFGWVSARDIISLLSPQLLPQEKAVLDCFADGLGPREIGQRLKMSHTMVIKHRRKIASLFARLDMSPLLRRGPVLANGHRHRINGNGHGPHALTITRPVALPAQVNGNGHHRPLAHANGNGHNGHSHPALPSKLVAAGSS